MRKVLKSRTGPEVRQTFWYERATNLSSWQWVNYDKILASRTAKKQTKILIQICSNTVRDYQNFIYSPTDAPVSCLKNKY